MREVWTYPNILARVSFRRTEEGGRNGPTPLEELRCPAELDGELFDCLLYLQGLGPVLPGEVVVVPIRFLSPKLVMPLLCIGKQFRLRDLRDIADAEVLQVYVDPPRRGGDSGEAKR